jgi:arabinose operon protein AraL
VAGALHFGRLRAVAFDLDGTLYLGRRAVTGAPEVVAQVRAGGLDVLFLTNTTSVDPQRLQRRLAGLAITATTAEIYSSASVAARYVAERGHEVAYVVGLPGLHDEVAAHGLRLTARPAEAQALVVGFVPGFDAATLPKGFRADCEFVAANLDADYPSDGGQRLPAARETVDKVAARLGRPCGFCAGKPGTFMLECVERDLGLGAGEIVVVGDSVTSDIAMARAAGCRSILIAPEGTTGGGASVVVARLTDVPAVIDVFAAGR